MQNNDVARMSPLSFYSEALSLKLGHKISPRMAIIHPTNRCNHNCTGCEYANVHAVKSPEFEQGSLRLIDNSWVQLEIGSTRLLKLVDEIADLGAASILFSGGGEPTMHESFAPTIEKAKQRKLLVSIFSNGTFIDQELAECIAQNATFIRISVDAATAETYAAIRRISPSVFDKLKLRIKMLIEAKNRLGSKLEVGLKFLVRPCNIGEILSFVTLANKLEVESVQYKPLRNAAEEPNLEQIQTAQKLIEQARGLCPDIKVQGGMSPEIKVLTRCWISPLRVVISAEGDVHLCNYFNHRRQTHTFGNINHSSLKNIWFSDAHRQALANIKVPECEFYDCRFHKLNVELLDLVENHREQLDFV